MENAINNLDKIKQYLGKESDTLLNYEAKGIPKKNLKLPGPNFMDEVFGISDRNVQVLQSLDSIYGHGRLGSTGYLSILPVDQGIEHTAGR
jgi:class I fructose-bisphosphate aldolase